MLAFEHNIIEGVGDNNKIDWAKTKAKNISKKNQNRKIAKSKYLIKLNHNFLSTKYLEGSESGFFTLKAWLVFIELRQAFVKAMIFHLFDPEWHILIETNLSDYTIGRVIGHIVLDDLGQWHPIVFFS